MSHILFSEHSQIKLLILPLIVVRMREGITAALAVFNARIMRCEIAKQLNINWFLFLSVAAITVLRFEQLRMRSQN